MGKEYSENETACKDGNRGVNARLSDIVSALDQCRFRIISVETDGSDYELRLRDAGEKKEN